MSLVDTKYPVNSALPADSTKPIEIATLPDIKSSPETRTSAPPNTTTNDRTSADTTISHKVESANLAQLRIIAGNEKISADDSEAIMTSMMKMSNQIAGLKAENNLLKTQLDKLQAKYEAELGKSIGYKYIIDTSNKCKYCKYY